LVKTNLTQTTKVAQKKKPENIIRELGAQRIELLKNTPEKHHTMK
jgi:GTP cyclohydrolase II